MNLILKKNAVKGADINRSYVEANKSDLSIGDLSHWFHTRRVTDTGAHPKRGAVEESSTILDTDMSNFKHLLHIVKDIIDGKPITESAVSGVYVV